MYSRTDVQKLDEYTHTNVLIHTEVRAHVLMVVQS